MIVNVKDVTFNGMLLMGKLELIYYIYIYLNFTPSSDHVVCNGVQSRQEE